MSKESNSDKPQKPREIPTSEVKPPQSTYIQNNNWRIGNNTTIKPRSIKKSK